MVRSRARTAAAGRRPLEGLRARDDRHLPPHPRPDRARPAPDHGPPRVPPGLGEGVGGGAEPRGSGRVRVTVVGGGLGGIAAALSCADGGAEVTLVEVRPRLGGAAYSFERDGMLLDNGQHVFLRCCTAYRALLERLGTAEATTLQSRLEIPVIAPGGQVQWLRRGRLPAPPLPVMSVTRGCRSRRSTASRAPARFAPPGSMFAPAGGPSA